MDAPIRVVVGEDDAFTREGIVRMLETAGIDVLAAVDDAVELVRVAEEHLPDLVVTDIQMPPNHSDDGLQAALAIRAAHPEIGVLVLSQYLDDQYALDLVAGRCRGNRLPAQREGGERRAARRRGEARGERWIGARPRCDRHG